DATAVHPESYYIVDAMAKDLETTVADIIKNSDIRDQIDVAKYVTDSVGIHTLNDILDELAKPGRDPRDRFEEFAFADGIEKIKDLKPGMKIPGLVTNITAFGAFVDIGVHQDGLVHISRMADRFVKNPADIVKVQQKITVTVVEVDLTRNRISLSMKSSSNHKSKAKNKPYKKKHKASVHQPKQKANTKKAKQKNTSFSNPLAEALRKSGFK
ncbi:MAG: S1 RNA-binding domain-containing protein, partial [Deltaproteobacteria bacterium]|nr:S1 RNA-binding domain-containing protein [Deltaproteobacteria bacterium]NNK85473.1 S1 RNA-binding domain-containing protein [Desulfobacterales bacterium]